MIRETRLLLNTRELEHWICFDDMLDTNVLLYWIA